MDNFRFRDWDVQVQALFGVVAVLFITAVGLAGWCAYWIASAIVGGL